jgi:hypothetical protein
MNNISHLKNTAMKSLFNKPALVLFSILCCLTLENVAQQIFPVDQDLAKRSMKKLKSNLKDTTKGGTGIKVSISELKALVENAEASGEKTVLLFVVGMDNSDKKIWGDSLNPTRKVSDWVNRQAIIFKFSKSVVFSSSPENNAAFFSPFALMYGKDFQIPYQASEFFALGALCPPPRDCTLY